MVDFKQHARGGNEAGASDYLNEAAPRGRPLVEILGDSQHVSTERTIRVNALGTIVAAGAGGNVYRTNGSDLASAVASITFGNAPHLGGSTLVVTRNNGYRRLYPWRLVEWIETEPASS